MNKYFLQLATSNKLADLMPFFGNFKGVTDRDKEISESMGCLNALISFWDRRDIDEYPIFVIGDGKRPRTGSVISHFTAANVTSIDPLTDLNWWNSLQKHRQEAEGRQIHRLELVQGKVEDNFPKIDFKKCFLVFPHSHAPLVDTVRYFNERKVKPHVVNLPCCVKVPEWVFKRSPCIEYIDRDILSPRNTFQLWKNLDLS